MRSDTAGTRDEGCPPRISVTMRQCFTARIAPYNPAAGHLPGARSSQPPMFSFINNDAEKVFGIGLSRTATTSLHAALGILGLRSFHWTIGPEKRILRLEDAYFCDAITDINAAFCFETLARMFPRAKFIYTSRPLHAWERSIVRHYGVQTPAQLKQRMRETPVTDAPAPEPLRHAVLY